MSVFQSLKRLQKAPVWGLFVFCLCIGHVQAAQAIQADQTDQLDRLPRQAGIASAHPLATAAGYDIIKAGGNAFDSAIAVAAVLGVVEPYGSGLGGGGFWLLHRQSDGKQIMLDSREKAPLAARRDMYLDDRGEVIPDASTVGPLSAGIPGIPAALAHLARNYGRLPLSISLAPAIRLARKGFPADSTYRRYAGIRLPVLKGSPAAARQFLIDGEVPREGALILQPDLARTLEAIAAHGYDGFYTGPVADNLVRAVRQAGGIWTHEDLSQYQVIERQPVIGQYQGYRIVTDPPPSAGVILIEMLNILDGRLESLEGADRIHFIVETMRRAYRDRAFELGDPDFSEIPVDRLISPAYARQLAADIDLKQATVSEDLPGFDQQKGRDTTHISVIDTQGNRVAATLSINYLFGSGFVAPGTGVLLNDEMDDFSAKPGEPNVYGLVGAEANAIAPGKRMQSSMTPTFVEGPNRIAILGTPGGSRITTMVLLAILDFVNGNGPRSWVSLPRFHHQYLPDRVQFEPDAFSEVLIEQLQQKGHKLAPVGQGYGNMQGVMWNKRTGEVSTASDPRGIGYGD